MSAGRRPVVPYVVGLLLVALAVGMGVSALASGAPDGLESAIVKSQCAEAPDQATCLAAAAGDAVYTDAPSGLAGYEVGWLSGLVGVLASFVVGAGVLLLIARRRQPRDPVTSTR